MVSSIIVSNPAILSGEPVFRGTSSRSATELRSLVVSDCTQESIIRRAV